MGPRSVPGAITSSTSFLSSVKNCPAPKPRLFALSSPKMPHLSLMMDSGSGQLAIWLASSSPETEVHTICTS